MISGSFAGMEHALRNLSKNLKETGAEVVIFTNHEMVKHYSCIKDIKTYNLGKYKKGDKITTRYNLHQISKRLKNYMQKENLDVLHLHSDTSIITYNMIRRKISMPFVISLRGTDVKSFQNSKSFLYKVFTKPTITEMFKKSQLITTVTDDKEIINLLKKFNKNIVIIPNGVDSKLFKPEKNITQKNNVILFAGRYMETKGIIEIINIAKKLPQYEFWFVGAGPLKKKIIGKNIKDLGFQSQKNLMKLYNQVSICIFPSWHEAFGNTRLEAMSCGKAIIATNIGFSEYMEDKKNSILIPTKDENALNDAIIDLMKNDNKRKRIGKKARKKALMYSWRNVAKIYIDTLKKSISNI